MVLIIWTGNEIKSSQLFVEQNRQVLIESIETTNSNILQISRDPSTWKVLLEKNSSLLCLQRYLSNTPDPSLPYCSHGQKGALDLYTSDGRLYMNSSQQQGQAMTLAGTVCPSGASTDLCPWSIRLEFEIDCDSPCTDPFVVLKSKLSLRSQIIERVVLNLAKYQVSEPIGPGSENPWALCASRNTVYLPSGFEEHQPDRRGCVGLDAFVGDAGPPGPPGPPGSVTTLSKRNSVTHCTGGKYAPNFAGSYSEHVPWQLLASGLNIRFFPALTHCTGVALDVRLVGKFGTSVRIPCRPKDGGATCYTFAGQTYLNMHIYRSPNFEIAPSDLQAFINNKEDIAEVRYDWAYNSGGPGATCYWGPYNKSSYAYALILQSTYDNKPSTPAYCPPVGTYIADPSIFQ